ncbi:gas vesicle protein GvpO [Nonomuraea sp. NPDC049141]|uniref:gas vesicle protein GvpO n=1 Tax=Nonomuraea sp. NPDC049141 TaxID=3155500 RepID=UPI0033DD15A7
MPVRRTAREERAADIRAEKGSREESDDVNDERRTEPRPKRRSRGLSVPAAGEAGLRHIAELAAGDPEGITLVEPVEGGWVVNVEVLEDHRIPSSGDILALYEAELDPEGKLLSYRRLQRYRRGSGPTEEGGPR